MSLQENWFHEGLQRLKKNRLALFCAYFIGFICLVAIFAKNLTPYPFDQQNIDRILEGPSHQYWMGTDKLGRDLFSRIIYGSRMSMAVGVITAILSLVIGALFGAISGWFGGWVDAIMMRIVDIAYSIPSLVIMILVKVIFDSINIFSHPELRALAGTLIALSIVGWVTLARLVRGQVLQVKTSVYIEAGRALGLSQWGLLFRHVFPNIMGPIIVMLTFRIPANILFESFLSFIGLGLQPPYSSWGVLASDGADMLESYPHLILFPGAALFLTMMAFQLLGDGLRDAFDPKMKLQ
ncbi:MAG: ABC transporter permease [Bdellovibrionales bacterium]|nr:ABC transporter permease [Bdellovibrionales bacterium]